MRDRPCQGCHCCAAASIASSALRTTARPVSASCLNMRSTNTFPMLQVLREYILPTLAETEGTRRRATEKHARAEAAPRARSLRLQV